MRSPDATPAQAPEGAADTRDPRLLLQRKADLDHLPEDRRRQLEAIAERICQRVPLDWLILFGSHARGDWVADYETGYFSDYDLLAIPSEPFLTTHYPLWERLGRELRALTDPIPVTLLVHTVQEVNHELRRGRYFFTDVIKEGVALVDTNRTSLASPPTLIPPEERLRQASFDLDYWFNSASGFWRGTGYYMARGENAHAAFSLHQAVERYYHAVTLVFTNYKYRTHDIEELAEKAANLHPSLAGVLPRGEPDDEERFDLLKRAYTDARYSKSYRISEQQLTILREQVLDLAQRVLPACRELLESILDADAVGELPALPGYGDEAEPPPVPDNDDPEALARWSRLVMEEGMEKGGQARAIEIARTLLGKGMTPEEVAKIAGLSQKEVEALK